MSRYWFIATSVMLASLVRWLFALSTMKGSFEKNEHKAEAAPGCSARSRMSLLPSAVAMTMVCGVLVLEWFVTVAALNKIREVAA